MTGMKAAMRAQDNIISAYRVHGWTYLMGVSPEGVLCELTGIIPATINKWTTPFGTLKIEFI